MNQDKKTDLTEAAKASLGYLINKYRLEYLLEAQEISKRCLEYLLKEGIAVSIEDEQPYRYKLVTPQGYSFVVNRCSSQGRYSILSTYLQYQEKKIKKLKP
jgi:hypothetical protein